MTNTQSAFWLSDCGNYIARELENANYDVMTVDGSKCWLARRYEPKGFDDTDPRYSHPEFAHAVTWFKDDSVGNKTAFTLGFADLDTSKRINPLTGNCIIQRYEARFSRRMKMRARPLSESQREPKDRP